MHIAARFRAALLGRVRIYVSLLRFSEAGIGGNYTNPEGETPEAKGPYVRPMKDLDCSKNEDVQKAKAVLAEALGNVCVRVTVDQEEEIDEMSDAAIFVDGLRSTPNLHFAAAGA